MRGEAMERQRTHHTTSTRQTKHYCNITLSVSVLSNIAGACGLEELAGLDERVWATITRNVCALWFTRWQRTETLDWEAEDWLYITSPANCKQSWAVQIKLHQQLELLPVILCRWFFNFFNCRYGHLFVVRPGATAPPASLQLRYCVTTVQTIAL